MENLSKQNFFAYAIQSYNNPNCCGMAEFKEDLLRVKYINRLIIRYIKTGNVKPRLLLNHLIGLSNVFLAESVSRMLFLRVDKSGWSALKTLLEYLNLMPESVPLIDGATIYSSNIQRDENLFLILIDGTKNF